MCSFAFCGHCNAAKKTGHLLQKKPPGKCMSAHFLAALFLFSLNEVWLVPFHNSLNHLRAAKKIHALTDTFSGTSRVNHDRATGASQK